MVEETDDGILSFNSITSNHISHVSELNKIHALLAISFIFTLISYNFAQLRKTFFQMWSSC